MEKDIIWLISDIIFKLSVLIWVITNFNLIRKLNDSIDNLWTLVTQQARYTADLQNQINKLKEKPTEKTKKKLGETK